MNFGPQGLNLYIDGELDENIMTLDTIECSRGGFSGGLDGNDNPWVFGVNSWFSVPGSAVPVDSPFDGAIDDVRISMTRRIYSRE